MWYRRVCDSGGRRRSRPDPERHGTIGPPHIRSRRSRKLQQRAQRTRPCVPGWWTVQQPSQPPLRWEQLQQQLNGVFRSGVSVTTCVRWKPELGRDLVRPQGPHENRGRRCASGRHLRTQRPFEGMRNRRIRIRGGSTESNRDANAYRTAGTNDFRSRGPRGKRKRGEGRQSFAKQRWCVWWQSEPIQQQLRVCLESIVRCQLARPKGPHAQGRKRRPGNDPYGQRWID
mmetsp:Transcript_8066/g.16687  ORF Transcript_8066/g.16687 Transcript_8066/m.16687 type:complete len:229 (+) Transcript_8066:503-1189(+)